MIKILIVFGTRPEAIKMAPVIKELKKHSDKFVCRICVTGQHRQLLDPILTLFEIKPDYDLNIMQINQTLEYITTVTLIKLNEILENEKPDYLLVQGDTTTAFAASLAAFYNKIKIAHIEAGLRTWNKFNPYPEEINRKLIDALSDLYFAHTERAKQNLILEGVSEEKIIITGNTVIDALLEIADIPFDWEMSDLKRIPFRDKKIILVTAHRRESFGQPLRNICIAIKEIAMRFSSDVVLVYPIHPNPNVKETVYSMLSNIENVYLIEPQEYKSFMHLVKSSYLILTDSGGLQEEAPSLGKPVLVLREATERIETVEIGAAKLVGTMPETIVENTIRLLKESAEYERMSNASNPYGDGKASQRIVAALLKEVNKNHG